MGRKKPFIDKKTASVFHVVRRSQRDVGTEATAETLSDFVLLADPENDKRVEFLRQQEAQSDGTSVTGKNKVAPDSFLALKQQISDAGLLDRTAETYSKYTSPIVGSGVFISSEKESNSNLNQLLTDTSKNSLDTALQEAMAVHEVGRMLDAIVITPECMDEDMARALFEEYDEGEYEEILDDFCLTANMEPENAFGSEGSTEFNFEEHIKKLMEKARMEHTGRKIENDFFSGVTPLHVQRSAINEDYESDDFNYDQYRENDSLDEELNDESEHEFAHPVDDEEQRILCQKFEDTLLEYDSDNVGNLDNECEDIGGSLPLEGDSQLEAALNEFLSDEKDEELMKGIKNFKKTGGSGYSALIGKTMVHASQLLHDSDQSKSLLINVEESKRQMQKELAEADAILANPEIDLPFEEILIDGKSYFSETPRNPWDCESILSTYSNLDNNPIVIPRSSKSKKKKNKKKGLSVEEGHTIPENGPVRINLSNKTGLPLALSPEEVSYIDNDASDTYISINKGEARNKAESSLEKKTRKMAIKEERKICRIQKKILKEAFLEEFQKQGSAEVKDAVGGTSVFRFS